MLNKDFGLYLANINYLHPFLRNFWDQIYKNGNEQTRFQIDIAKRFGKNRLVSRNGQWPNELNVAIAPGFEMPVQQNVFKKTFSEVTNERAIEIQTLIRNSGSRVSVYYSGGIDSVICLTALIQNLGPEELKQIDVCLSSESLIENPDFFQKHILGRFNIFDSSTTNYRDIELKQNFAITCDQGDSIFGTELATEMYYKYDIENIKDDHYSKYVDKLVDFFSLDGNPQFGARFYEKMKLNIESASVSVYSLHDFFWWIIFNLKYMDCALRGAVFYYEGDGNREKSVNRTIINWFGSEDYQQWSMANNNNGQKIHGNSAASYKWAGRQYIHSFDGSSWYLRHKLKLSSLINLAHRNENKQKILNTFALNDKYDLLSLSEEKTQDYIKSRLC